MSQLGFSDIQDDLVLYINNGEILYTLDAKSTNEKYYFQLFSNRGIIDVTSDEHIVSISSNNFKTMIRAKEKNVFFIVVFNNYKWYNCCGNDEGREKYDKSSSS